MTEILITAFVMLGIGFLLGYLACLRIYSTAWMRAMQTEKIKQAIEMERELNQIVAEDEKETANQPAHATGKPAPDR
jgi:hypothetical protein